MSINPIPAAIPAAANTPTTSSANGNSPDTTTMFMKLLATELQSQDPTQTMDPTTMVTQMVQINQLNDVAGIYSILKSGGTTAPAGQSTHSILGGN